MKYTNPKGTAWGMISIYILHRSRSRIFSNSVSFPGVPSQYDLLSSPVEVTTVVIFITVTNFARILYSDAET